VDLKEREQHAQRHPWEVARARHFRRLVADAFPAPPTSVIDIGSGDGWFADQLRADLAPGSTIVCVDANYTADDLAQPLPDGISRRTSPPGEPARLVLALDVLEHIDDDVTFVADHIAPLVAADGVFIASVPAHQRLFTSHDVALGHHRRHDAASLRALLEPHFDVVREGSLFTTLLPPRAASALVEKVRPPTGEPQVDSVWRHGTWISRSITTVLDADAALGRLLADRRHRPPGLSVWAVCRPRTAG
jgi:hypothetical protein